MCLGETKWESRERRVGKGRKGKKKCAVSKGSEDAFHVVEEKGVKRRGTGDLEREWWGNQQIAKFISL